MRQLIFILLIFLLPSSVLAAPKVVLKKPPAAQCKALVDSLKKELEVGNYCQSDADCVAISLGCPLPCASPLNRNEDIARMAALKESYDHVCAPCDSDCPTLSGTPVCVNRKCIVK